MLTHRLLVTIRHFSVSHVRLTISRIIKEEFGVSFMAIIMDMVLTIVLRKSISLLDLSSIIVGSILWICL